MLFVITLIDTTKCIGNLICLASFILLYIVHTVIKNHSKRKEIFACIQTNMKNLLLMTACTQ